MGNSECVLLSSLCCQANKVYTDSGDSLLLFKLLQSSLFCFLGKVQHTLCLFLVIQIYCSSYKDVEDT